MIQVKLFKRMALIMTLSAACVASTGCSYTAKPEQTENSVDGQTEEIVIKGTDFSVEESKDLETNAPTITETPTADAPTDSLDMSENEASLVSERRVFALSNGDSNAEQVTAHLDNSIYNLSIKKGESGQGAAAFLHKADSTEPLNFIGFGNIIKFNITN